MTDTRAIDQTVASADGTVIAFELLGSGAPVVCVGGALTARGYFAEIATALAQRYTAVTYDRRGRGGSGNTLPYAVEREIEDLAAVIAACGAGVRVYAHSSGAALALRAAAAGATFDRLCVYEPPLIAFDGGRGRPPFVDALVALLDEGRDADAVEYFLLAALQTPADVVERAKAGPGWPQMVALAPTLPYEFTLSGADGVAGLPDLARVDMPVLALDGGLSPGFVRTMTAEVAAAIPNARHATIPDQRHNPTLDALAPVLFGFFSTTNL